MSSEPQQKFEYKDIDAEGLEILDVISSAAKFNRWLYQIVSPFCNGKILEIGSGVGNISDFFISDKKDIYLSDIRENYRSILSDKFKLDTNHVLDIDIAHTDFDKTYASLLSSFNSVFALNVVEHIKDDDLAIKNMLSLLKPGGQMTILVPAYQALYNDIDLSLEHFKRYNRTSLSKLMSKHAPIKKSFYFNATGILAWWISGRILKHKTIPAGEMRLYNTFVPVFKFIDKIVLKKMGLSVVCVIQKP
ncbi:class I SAM-dependent methyltransferase [Aurantibacillus circumpalustris]|uniref:class I SAM-dependent methyltransferase n=1 Tax=Aurantibacillus circumpalustris TaxID=3036359 RepID=UPI00295B4E9A|nr:methyltransferase domain-containing protein [Aurantibacillus circumpalustris]